MTRVLRPGPATIEGLRWLSRVGPAPLDAWRCAMGWSEVAARSHARRLEREGWLSRYPMTRGHGSLFVATRTGVAVANVDVRAAAPPAPTWWAHHRACAWVAAWLTVRGREMIAGRELLIDDRWSGEIAWHDDKGRHEAGHRPDLIGILNGWPVALEVELAKKSAARLEAILTLHASWKAAGKASVYYVCGDADVQSRIPSVAKKIGYAHDRGFHTELLDTITQQAIEEGEANRAESGFRRPAAHAVGNGS